MLEADASASVDVQLRFLQVVDRQVLACVENRWQPVDSLSVDDREFQSWQECVERRVEQTFRLGELLAKPVARRFSFADKPRREKLVAHDGRTKGIVVRRQARVRGTMRVTAAPVGDGATMVAISIFNDSRVPEVAATAQQSGLSEAARDREAASLCAMAALHVIVHGNAGRFVSSIDPSPERRQAVDQVRSDGLWPVLVGTPGERDTMLCSPIILYDYPQIAEQSPGDFFDGTEIDEMLALRVLTLTDDEKRRVAGFDERGQALFGACATWPSASWRTCTVSPAVSIARRRIMEHDWDFTEPRSLECIQAGPYELRIGDRVRIRPRARADIFDMALCGKCATIDSIEQDFENRVHLALTVDDDPAPIWDRHA